MKKCVVYIHGKGGSAGEADHYKPIFPAADVVGFDYASQTPWDAAEEFPAFIKKAAAGHTGVTIIANSIGAYFALCSLGGARIEKAYLISPVVDMEGLILDMMAADGITEAELKEKGEIQSSGGGVISYKYLVWAREHPTCRIAPTEILYGDRDILQPRAALKSFAERTGAGLTVMDGGEHWFHTESQMRFLDEWIISSL